MLARLICSREIAPEVRHFEFEIPELHTLAFEPGQFLSFSDIVEGKTVTRAYSIASAPRGNRFDLCLNRVREGRLSPRLFALQPGETIACRGPFGSFTMRQPGGDILMVASGTGVAPFRSMIQAYLNRDSERRWVLLMGVRFEESILYRTEFEEMAKTHPRFRFLPTLTRPDPEWRGLTGRVQAHLATLLSDLREPHVYVCGMKAMVNDVRALLLSLGLDRSRILTEKYDN